MPNELDLQDETRMLDTYNDITDIIDRISKLSVFPSLVWVWSWDVALDLYRDFRDGGQGDEYGVTMDEKAMWQLFWEQADQNGFTLEFGAEDLYDAIRDWMFDQSIVEFVEFDEDEDVVLESEQEEV